MEGQAACSRSIQIKRPLNTPTKPNSKREANFSTPLYKVALTKPKDFSKIFTDGNEALKPTALKFTEEVHSVGETSDHSSRRKGGLKAGDSGSGFSSFRPKQFCDVELQSRHACVGVRITVVFSVGRVFSHIKLQGQILHKVL